MALGLGKIPGFGAFGLLRPLKALHQNGCLLLGGIMASYK